MQNTRSLNVIDEAVKTALTDLQSLRDQLDIITYELVKLSQLPDQSEPVKPNTETVTAMFLDCGFLCAEEIETQQARDIIGWASREIKPQIPNSIFKKTAKNVVWNINQKGVKDKYPYMKNSLKNAVKGYKNGGGQQ